ncbi:MAG: hypothetical protein HC888_00715 [Candidatus Competibacteraceae bacterium]|nr:hypothetical protein [Candidatus Competibacteraceae bacterium]
MSNIYTDESSTRTLSLIHEFMGERCHALLSHDSLSIRALKTIENQIEELEHVRLSVWAGDGGVQIDIYFEVNGLKMGRYIARDTLNDHSFMEADGIEADAVRINEVVNLGELLRWIDSKIREAVAMQLALAA